MSGLPRGTWLVGVYGKGRELWKTSPRYLRLLFEIYNPSIEYVVSVSNLQRT